MGPGSGSLFFCAESRIWIRMSIKMFLCLRMMIQKMMIGEKKLGQLFDKETNTRFKEMFLRSVISRFPVNEKFRDKNAKLFFHLSQTFSRTFAFFSEKKRKLWIISQTSLQSTKENVLIFFAKQIEVKFREKKHKRICFFYRMKCKIFGEKNFLRALISPIQWKL